MCQSKLQWHHFSPIIPGSGTGRTPDWIIHNKSLWHIWNLVTGCISILHCQSVQKRFYSTSNLSFLISYCIIFEISEIRSANICFYISGMWIHWHKSRSCKIFIIPYRIKGRHNCINLSIPGKNPHLYRLVKGCINWIFRNPGIS